MGIITPMDAAMAAMEAAVKLGGQSIRITSAAPSAAAASRRSISVRMYRRPPRSRLSASSSSSPMSEGSTRTLG